MLELRPSCEHCNRDLPPASAGALICSFGCTICRPCVEQYFGDGCPNCGGNLVARPVRPAKDRCNGNYLGKYPASTTVVHRPKDLSRHAILQAAVAHLPPQER